jgi:hypothetical protein
VNVSYNGVNNAAWWYSGATYSEGTFQAYINNLAGHNDYIGDLIHFYQPGSDGAFYEMDTYQNNVRAFRSATPTWGFTSLGSVAHADNDDGWQRYTVKHHSNGTQEIYVNGTNYLNVTDTTYTTGQGPGIHIFKSRDFGFTNASVWNTSIAICPSDPVASLGFLPAPTTSYCGINPNATIQNNAVNLYLNLTGDTSAVDTVWFSNVSNNYTSTSNTTMTWNLSYTPTLPAEMT